MGLFGFGGGGKVKRLVKKLTNAYVQTAERMRIMQVLADIGTTEAYEGLMQRFTYRTEASIVDEDEKRTAYELIVSAGPSVIPAIEAFVSKHENIYWPAKALGELAGKEQAVRVLLNALAKASEATVRRNEQRAQLVSNLRDFPHPDVQAKLDELVDDEDEDVRIMAIDGLMTYGEEVARDRVVRRLLHEDEVPRVRTVLFEQLIEAGWSLKDFKAEIEEADILPAYYRIGKGGALERA